MEASATIYGLVDPRANHLRYVGQTVDPAHRPMHHVKPTALRDPSHRTHWLRSLLAAGLKPEVVEIEVVPITQRDEAEECWIGYFRSIGAALTNYGSGGHVGGQKLGFRHSEAAKAKLRAARLGKPSPRGTGWHHSPETIAKISAAHRGKTLSVEHRQAVAAAMRGKKRGPYKTTRGQ